MGLVAPRHMGSSWTRDQTYVPCIGRQILNHCTTREVPREGLWLSLVSFPKGRFYSTVMSIKEWSSVHVHVSVCVMRAHRPGLRLGTMLIKSNRTSVLTIPAMPSDSRLDPFFSLLIPLTLSPTSVLIPSPSGRWIPNYSREMAVEIELKRSF